MSPRSCLVRVVLLTLALVGCGHDPTAPPDAATKVVCPNPKPFSVGGQPTGYVWCDGYQLHRAEVRVCPSLLPRAQVVHAPAPSIEEHCRSDADCTEHPHGHCELSIPGEGIGGWFCDYGCL